MTTPEPGARPAFVGLDVFRDLTYRYSFLYPQGWHQSALESAEGQGVILTPTPSDIRTSFSAEARDLGTTIAAADLEILRQGVAEGLQRLPELEIERQEDYSIGQLTGLEIWFTYQDVDDGQRRKRWLRLLYQGTVQLRLIAQGADEAAFDYWLPMFTEIMRTVQFADWWAEVLGVSWRPSLQKGPEDE